MLFIYSETYEVSGTDQDKSKMVERDGCGCFSLWQEGNMLSENLAEGWPPDTKERLAPIFSSGFILHWSPEKV